MKLTDTLPQGADTTCVQKQVEKMYFYKGQNRPASEYKIRPRSVPVPTEIIQPNGETNGRIPNPSTPTDSK